MRIKILTVFEELLVLASVPHVVTGLLARKLQLAGTNTRIAESTDHHFSIEGALAVFKASSSTQII
jgi:hypothetical protein